MAKFRDRLRTMAGACGLLTCLGLHAAGYYGDGVYVDADINLRYDSNLGRSGAATDIEEDMITALSAGAGYMKTLGGNSQLLISAYLAHENFAEFKDLNNVAVNADIVYTIQPSKGYTSPWYQASAGVTAFKFNKSQIRDGYIVSAGLGMGKRFTDRIQVRADYNYRHRRSDARVFDNARHDLKGQVIYSWRRGLSLFAAYDLQIGDVVSTATPNPAIIAAAETMAPDDVFTPIGGPGCMNRRCAYRLDAVAHIFELGLEKIINNYASVDLSTSRFIVNGEGVDSYRGWIYRAGLYLRF